MLEHSNMNTCWDVAGYRKTCKKINLHLVSRTPSSFYLLHPHACTAIFNQNAKLIENIKRSSENRGEDFISNCDTFVCKSESCIEVEQPLLSPVVNFDMYVEQKAGIRLLCLKTSFREDLLNSRNTFRKRELLGVMYFAG